MKRLAKIGMTAALILWLPNALAATYTVTKTADTNDGSCDASDCSLREAITAANASGATPHTINFAMTTGCSGSTCTISPTSQLPSLTRGQTTLDGTTQSGAVTNSAEFPAALNGTLTVVLNGAGAGSTSRGLKITSANNVIKGLVIQNFKSTGIEVSGASATGNKIQGCYVGTDVTGTSGAGNAGVGGIYLASSNNVLGSDSDGANDAAERNLISGNTGSGVAVTGASNQVSGNFIGTDKNGSADLGNSNYGLTVSGDGNVLGTDSDGANDAAEGNLVSGNDNSGFYFSTAADDNVVTASRIGTNAAGDAALPNAKSGIYNAGNRTLIGVHSSGTEAENEGNVISGNTQYGVHVNNGGSVVVAGNAIGTGATGLAAVANGLSGVLLVRASNRVGTDGDGVNDELERNVISGNAAMGVYISGSSATSNTVAGNYIGVGSDGLTDLGNGSHGIGLYSSSSGGVIGGDAASEANTIAYNGDSGTAEYGVIVSSSSGNRVLRNSFRQNQGDGVKLGTGASLGNAGKSAPGITGQSGTSSALVISGTAATGDTVQLFDASADAEGETYIDQATADASGNWQITIGSTYAVTGNVLTATATDASNNTSAFSASYTLTSTNAAPVAGDVTVYAGTGFTVNFTLPASDADASDTLSYSYTAPSGVSGTAPELAYTPSGVMDETVTFEFTVTDSAGESDTGTVTIAPAAEPIRIGAGGFLTRLYQDPSDPDSCWATSDIGGIFLSTDGCDTFEPKNQSFWRDDHFSVDDVLVDAGAPDTVYAIGGTYLLSSSYPASLGCCLWKSTDRGENWSPLLRKGDGACDYYKSTGAVNGFKTTCTGGSTYLRLDGRKDEELYSSSFSSSDHYGQRALADGKRLATDPSSCASGACQTIYVADFKKGVYKSLDGGENFSQLPLPAITSYSANLRVSSVNLLPYTSGGATEYLILVGARFANSTSSAISAASTYSDGALYLGFNGGEDPGDWVTLTPSASELTDIRDIAVPPDLDLGTIDANDIIHIAAGKMGVIKGAFTALNATTPSASLTFSYASNCGVAASGSYGTGLDFETTCDESIATSTYVAVEADPADGNNLYATSLGQGDGQVYHSTDGGANWTALVDTSDMSNFDYNGIWFNQHSWKVASFAATVTFVGRDADGNESSGGDAVAFSDFWAAWKSPNDGTDSFTAHYRGIENVVFQDVASDPFDPERLYIGVSDHAFFTSEDGGETTTLRGCGGSTPYPDYSGIAAGQGIGTVIDFSRTQSASGSFADRVFLATNNNTTQGGKLYESSDGGETFTDIGASTALPVGYVKAIAYDATNERLYAALNSSSSVTDASGVTGDANDSDLYCLDRTSGAWAAHRISAVSTAIGDTGSDLFSNGPQLVYHENSGKLFIMHNSSSTSYRLLYSYTPGANCHDGTVTPIDTSVILDGASRAKLQAVAVDPDDANKIHLGTYRQGLWSTADGGANWTRAYLDPDAASATSRSSSYFNRSINDIVIHPDDHDVLLVGGQTDYYDDSNGSYYGVQADIVSAGRTYYASGVVVYDTATGNYTDVTAAIAPFGRDVQALHVDADQPYRLLVGTSGQGGMVLHLDDIVNWSGTDLAR